MQENVCRNGRAGKAGCVRFGAGCPPAASSLLASRSMRQPPGAGQPAILVVCASEMILCGVTGLLASAGYAVYGFPDPWRARKLLGSRRFDLALVGAPDPATEDLLAQLGRCAPP